MSAKDYHETVNPEDPAWKDPSDKPKRNGWYDAWGRRKLGEGVNDIVCSILFRNGEWISDIHAELVAWREPVKMADDKGRGIGNDDGMFHLASEITEQIMLEYLDFYRIMVDPFYEKTSARKTAADKIRYLEKQMHSPLLLAIYFAAGTDPDTVISSYQAMVKKKFAKEKAWKKK